MLKLKELKKSLLIIGLLTLSSSYMFSDTNVPLNDKTIKTIDYKKLNQLHDNMSKFNVYKIMVLNNISINNNDKYRDLKIDILENIDMLLTSSIEETKTMIRYNSINNDKSSEELLNSLGIFYNDKSYSKLVNQLKEINSIDKKEELSDKLNSWAINVEKQNQQKYKNYLEMLNSKNIKNRVNEVFNQEQLDIILEIRDDLLSNEDN